MFRKYDKVKGVSTIGDIFSKYKDSFYKITIIDSFKKTDVMPKKTVKVFIIKETKSSESKKQSLLDIELLLKRRAAGCMPKPKTFIKSGVNVINAKKVKVVQMSNCSFTSSEKSDSEFPKKTKNNKNNKNIFYISISPYSLMPKSGQSEDYNSVYARHYAYCSQFRTSSDKEKIHLGEELILIETNGFPLERKILNKFKDIYKGETFPIVYLKDIYEYIFTLMEVEDSIIFCDAKQKNIESIITSDKIYANKKSLILQELENLDKDYKKYK